MNIHPPVYWRYCKEQKHLLNKKGKIITVTKQSDQWIGVIKTGSETVTAPIVAMGLVPLIGDTVVGVLRIMASDDPDGLILYGIKFQLLKI